MNRIGRIVRRITLVLAALVALLILLVVLSRLTTPSAEQREAVAVMQGDDLPRGPNAFGLLWTLDRDVPFDEIDAVVRADVAQVAGWPDVWEAGEAPVQESEWRRDVYPDLSPSRKDRERFCRLDEETPCLAQVRAASEATAEVVSRHSQLLERIRRLRDAEVLRNAMPPKPLAPIPEFSSGILPMTAHALMFVQGDEHRAVAETCRDLATWRRLALNTDILIMTLVGSSYAGRGYGALLAEMLAEWPVDQPLPAACEAALAPMPDDDLPLCHALRGEFRRQETTYDLTHVTSQAESWLERTTALMYYDYDSTIALAAEQLAPYCSADIAGGPELDQSASLSDVLLRWSCLANSMGCVMTSITHGVYGDYADRVADFDIRIRQLRILAWMRSQAATSARADTLLERLPPELRDTDQPVELAPDGRSLRVALTDDRRDDWAEVPLPPALWRVAPADAD